MRYIGLAALTARAFSALEDAVSDAADDLVIQARAAAPVEQGTLRGSIQTDGARRKGAGVEAVVYTSAEAGEYAAKQHERLDFSHPSGGQAKFLEFPLIQNRQRYGESLRRAARVRF